MVTTNGSDRHLSSGIGPAGTPLCPEIPRGLACDGLQPGSDGQALVMTAAMASDPQRSSIGRCAGGVSRQAFGTERFQRRPNR